MAKELNTLQPSLSLKGSTYSPDTASLGTPSADEYVSSMRPRSILLGYGIGGGAEESEDAEAMLELQKIMKLKNTADWGMMTIGLKSFSRRISRKGVDIQDLKIAEEEVKVTGIRSL